MRYSLVLIVFLLTGCVGQPTHYATSKLVHSGLPDNWSIERELEEKDKRSLRDLLDSPEMNRCLTAILENSHELKLSVLEQAQRALLVDQSASQRRPEVNLIASANRTKSNDFGTNYQSRYQLGAQVSWELDLWGKLASQEASSFVDLKMSQLQEQALKRSLIGQTLKTLVHLSSSKLQQGLLSRSTFLQENEVIRAKQQIQMGSVRLLDLEAASLNYQQSKSQMILAERTSADLENSLQRLTGLLGNAVACPEFALDIILHDTDVSSRYLLNRPDVQLAFLNVTRADLASDIAYKSLFPSFSLSLDATQTAVGRQNLLGADPMWSLLGKIIQPVFNSGRLETEVKIAELGAQKALIEYRQSLETAYFEIRALMNNELHLAKQIRTLKAGCEANKRSLVSIEKQYMNGLLEHDQWLEIRQEKLRIKQDLNALETEQLVNRIDLFLALGLPLP